MNELGKLIVLNLEKLKMRASQPLSASPCVMRARKKLFVLQRDGFKCVLCGSTERLTVDHIAKNAQFRHRSAACYKPELCRTLCAQCHVKKNSGLSDEQIAPLAKEVQENDNFL